MRYPRCLRRLSACEVVEAFFSQDVIQKNHRMYKGFKSISILPDSGQDHTASAIAFLWRDVFDTLIAGGKFKCFFDLIKHLQSVQN